MPISLLADSGSTKTAWSLLRPGQAPVTFQTDGLNPYFQTEAQLRQTLQAQLLPQLPPATDSPVAVYFYGTGCTGPEANNRVAGALKSALTEAGYSLPRMGGVADPVFVASDMLGAARSVAGREPGIVCILGTGSNACFYDGEQLASPSYSLGFWLGDEGSGGNLGRRLVTAFLHGLLPEPLHDAFAQQHPLDRLTVLDHAYNKPYPNRYFAGFTPFLGQYQQHSFVQDLLNSAFTDFVRLYVCRMPHYQTMPIHFVGSVAYYFKPMLEQVLHAHNLTLGNVEKAPMIGLTTYHGGFPTPD